MMKRWLGMGLILLIVTTGYALSVAADLSSGEIPPELGRWRSWVLHGQEETLCPSAYNDGTVVRCQWPTQLTVHVQDDGALFEQRWLVFAQGWVSLHGSLEMWPDGVVVDSLSNVLKNNPELIKNYVSKYSKIDNSFNALNSVYSVDGYVVYLPDSKIVEKPVQVLFLNRSENDEVLSLPRNIVIAGKNSQVKIITSYNGYKKSTYFPTINTSTQ